MAEDQKKHQLEEDSKKVEIRKRHEEVSNFLRS